MSRLPSPAAGALAIAVAVLASAAAGCSGGGHPGTTAAVVTRSSLAPCRLDKAQRRAVARARADIRRLQRIEAPVQTFSQHGAPSENTVTGKLMLDLGATKLPPNVFAQLIHQAKTAVALCGDCTQGLEADEPFLGNQQQTRCG